eukprot:scaffold21056_cov67-Skeletonema_dohrnii-CCMP3373.AAC.1
MVAARKLVEFQSHGHGAFVVMGMLDINCSSNNSGHGGLKSAKSCSQLFTKESSSSWHRNFFLFSRLLSKCVIEGKYHKL